MVGPLHQKWTAWKIDQMPGDITPFKAKTRSSSLEDPEAVARVIA